jgi:hypothetical protein
MTMRHGRQTAKMLPIAILSAVLLCLWEGVGHPQPSNPAGAASPAAQPAANPSAAQMPEASPTPAAPGHKHKRRHRHRHKLPNIPPVPPPSIP